MKRSREEVERTPRKAFTKKERETLYASQNGLCGGCGTPLGPSGTEVDHRIQIWLGGAHGLQNAVALCVPCHRGIKTPLDAKVRAKVKRIIKRETEGPKPSRMRSRGFGKTLRKKMDGTVERR